MPVPDGPEKITYEGRMFEMVEQPMKVGERIIVYENARRAPGVRLIIPTPDGKLLLSNEYRSYMGRNDIRLPGGKVFDSLIEYRQFRESGNKIEDAAKDAAIKEAGEEVGIRVEDIELFTLSNCGASVEWDLYYFVVKSYSSGEQALEHGENITPILIEREEAKKMCLDGRIGEERSALTLLRYLALHA